ncbi:MAG: dicarboxylate/amino acid:cation symporter, partial [Gemmatimonadota bacterium]|nr:dicarboxylate/amino acid:cation symporter [Gemmatimonadota bacterium]
AAGLGRTSVGRFARATAPAQGIAFSSRSSLAALPAMIEGAAALRLSREIAGFFLPLSASLFRLGGAVALPAGVLFVARLYGVDLSVPQLVTVGVTSVLLTFSVPGIPGGSILIMAPVLLSAGLPVEGIGLLLGVDTIPDMFRTTTNVTGHMAAATILGSSESRGNRRRSRAGSESGSVIT